MRRKLITAISALLLVGCLSHSKRQQQGLTEEAAISIARECVRTNDTWAERAQYTATQQPDGSWLVTVWRIEGYDDDRKPLFVTGGYRDVWISREGAVTAYMRGL